MFLLAAPFIGIGPPARPSLRPLHCGARRIGCGIHEAVLRATPDPKHGGSGRRRPAKSSPRSSIEFPRHHAPSPSQVHRPDRAEEQNDRPLWRAPCGWPYGQNEAISADSSSSDSSAWAEKKSADLQALGLCAFAPRECKQIPLRLSPEKTSPLDLTPVPPPWLIGPVPLPPNLGRTPPLATAVWAFGDAGGAVGAPRP